MYVNSQLSLVSLIRKQILFSINSFCASVKYKSFSMRLLSCKTNPSFWAWDVSHWMLLQINFFSISSTFFVVIFLSEANKSCFYVCIVQKRFPWSTSCAFLASYAYHFTECSQYVCYFQFSFSIITDIFCWLGFFINNFCMLIWSLSYK